MDKSKQKKSRELDMETFLALPDEEKERIYQEIDQKTPEEIWAESRPLNAEERRRWARFKRGLRGRPKISEGAKPINVTVEQGLLRRADSWAKDHGMSRSQLIARGLELVMAGNGSQRSEIRGRKSGTRSRKSEVGGQKSEVGHRK
jgi:hypothetical protein